VADVRRTSRRSSSASRCHVGGRRFGFPARLRARRSDLDRCRGSSRSEAGSSRRDARWLSVAVGRDDAIASAYGGSRQTAIGCDARVEVRHGLRAACTKRAGLGLRREPGGLVPTGELDKAHSSRHLGLRDQDGGHRTARNGGVSRFAFRPSRYCGRRARTATHGAWSDPSLSRIRHHSSYLAPWASAICRARRCASISVSRLALRWLKAHRCQ
jgi:hypothetical protein